LVPIAFGRSVVAIPFYYCTIVIFWYFGYIHSSFNILIDCHEVDSFKFSHGTQYRSLAPCYSQSLSLNSIFYVFSPLLFSQALTILKHKDPQESFTCMTLFPSVRSDWHVHMDKLKHISSIYNRSLHLQPNYRHSLPGKIMLSNLRENVAT
jgi:hypothetical protein